MSMSLTEKDMNVVGSTSLPLPYLSYTSYETAPEGPRNALSTYLKVLISPVFIKS
jgi:hypothetical protein